MLLSNILGGGDGGFNPTDGNVYVLQYSNGQYTWTATDTSSVPSSPGPRMGHSAVLWNNTIVLFGGWGPNQSMGDTGVYYLTTTDPGSPVWSAYNRTVKMSSPQTITVQLSGPTSTFTESATASGRMPAWELAVIAVAVALSLIVIITGLILVKRNRRSYRMFSTPSGFKLARSRMRRPLANKKMEFGKGGLFAKPDEQNYKPNVPFSSQKPNEIVLKPDE